MNYKNALLPLCLLTTGALATSNYASLELMHLAPTITDSTCLTKYYRFYVVERF